MESERVTPVRSFDVAEAKKHLSDFVKVDHDRNEILIAALQQLTDQECSLSTLALELEDQKRSRCRYQKEARDFEKELASLKRRIEKNTLVAVLVDGDGAKFTSELLQAREAGGGEAARRLNQAICHYLKGTEPELYADDASVVVHVWANLGGLAKVLVHDGSIGATDHMSEFAEGFSRNRAEFNFVNVGRGKENADNKLRRMFNFYHNNIQCKKIFFAGCHDTGYVHDLEEKRGTGESERRIVLLETTPAEPKFRQLGFPITHFDNVFRNQPLDNETKRSRTWSFDGTPSNDMRTTVASPLTCAALSSKSQTPWRSKAGGKDDEEAENDLGRVSSTVKRSENGGISINYASAGKDKDHHNVDISTTKSEQRRSILYNAAQQRLDLPNNRSWSVDAQQSYNKKIEQIKPKVFCNEFYLVGDCPRGDSCFFDHSKELSREELKIHRYRARTGPCVTGPSCQNFNCYSSHHCPAGKSCYKGPDCLFSEAKSYYGDLHFREPMEEKAVLRRIEGQRSLEKMW